MEIDILSNKEKILNQHESLDLYKVNNMTCLLIDNRYEVTSKGEFI